MRDVGIWVVDRINGAVAVLVRDRNAQRGHKQREDVPVTLLPEDIRAGVVLRVPETDGVPVWSDAVADEALRTVRLREAEEVLKRLRERDPGGDIEL
ncbi:MAG: DUF3006 family protein [Gemmatimonadetes bacterium]|nr:DUF3006 family protein [Gemmatimonadota bacterium]